MASPTRFSGFVGPWLLFTNYRTPALLLSPTVPISTPCIPKLYFAVSPSHCPRRRCAATNWDRSQASESAGEGRGVQVAASVAMLIARIRCVQHQHSDFGPQHGWTCASGA
ncbi:hypothetical protein FA95DRAFT_1565588 [Auriscalpium vulgare]|uniref:Uncharacterized protein n=1 Tax=Auriscalpium vulgare TaxID=40419 RepID=A0ACB8RB24_9AGAM|nr:hypothetical protein FA95DRAFT_1565588 [Auriscalpium vulgare]